MGKRKKGVKVNGLFWGVRNSNSALGIPNERACTESVQVRGKTGGKAWFGGLACSGLAGYRACCERGNASVKHFYPLIFSVEAIIPNVTDKLLLVTARGDLLNRISDFLGNLSQSCSNNFVVFVVGILCNLMIIKTCCSKNNSNNWMERRHRNR